MKVWTCKIVVPDDAVLPEGFDLPPRRAAMNAIQSRGVDVVTCFSGWGGALTPREEECLRAMPLKETP